MKAEELKKLASIRAAIQSESDSDSNSDSDDEFGSDSNKENLPTPSNKQAMEPFVTYHILQNAGTSSLKDISTESKNSSPDYIAECIKNAITGSVIDAGGYDVITSTILGYADDYDA